MTTPKSVAIVSNIVSTIRGINGSPTYNNSVDSQQVSAKLLNLSKIPADAWPHVCVYYAGEQREQEHSQFMVSQMQINIDVYFRNLQGEEDNFADKFLRDIEVALAQDVQRGQNYVHNSYVQSVDMDTRETDNQIYRMVFPVIYSFPFGSP